MFHGMTPELRETSLDSYCIEAVFGGVAADGALLLACIRRKIPVASLCFTDLHADKLKTFLVDSILKAFATEGSPLYIASYAQAPKNATEDAETSTAPRRPSRSPRRP